MSYQVLARKWRPQNFTEMVGQEHVLRALINALDSDRLHHAYLFTGTRGVGKTTIARILAKCLNCETGVTSKPCGECSSCKEIVSGNFVDLIEVDAASRTKVEDTRELLDNVQYAPTRGRFKVYLIDEVHMLTGHSFNALLKTLEEPPPHVKFLFATTDPQKLPVTILSRCLQFNLKRMPVDMISGHLNYLLEQEKIPFEKPSLRLIARAADGSMRDALSLLDQSIAFSGENLKEADVREMLGTISHEPLLALLTAIKEGDGASLLQQVEDLSGVTPDFEAATDALISLLHQLAVLQAVPDAQEDDENILEFTNSISKEEVQLFYQIALHGRRDLPLSPDPRSGFEMLLLRMMSFAPLKEGMHLEQSGSSSDNKKKSPEAIAPAGNKTPVEKIAEKSQAQPTKTQSVAKKSNQTPPPWEIDAEIGTGSDSVSNIDKKKANNNEIAQKGIKGGGCVLDSNNQASKAPKTAKNPENVKNKTNKVIEESVVAPKPSTRPSFKSSPKSQSSTEWHDTITQLKLGGRAAELIKHCLLESNENGIVSLLIESSSAGLLADSVQAEIQSALSTFYEKKIQLKLSVSAGDALVSQVTQGSHQNNETPAQRSARITAEVQQQAEQNIATDPFVLELQNRFGAQLVPGSVIPK